MSKRYHFIAGKIQERGYTQGVELGAHVGETTAYLLGNCPKLNLTVVDAFQKQPWNNGPQDYMHWNFDAIRERFLNRASPFFEEQRLVLLQEWTREAVKGIPDGSQDFVFFDADHGYEATCAEILRWAPKVRSGGMLFGHDYDWDSVRRAVADTLGNINHWEPDNVWWRIKAGSEIKQ